MKYKNEIFLESLFCVEAACKNLGLKFEYFGFENSNLEVFLPGKKSLFFYKNRMPFNSSINSTICKDKIVSYDYFLRYNIPTPDSIILLNPSYSEETFNAAEFKTSDTLFEHASKKWGTPFIIKKSVSSLSLHVHLVQTLQDLEQLWQTYFHPDSPGNSLLAQEFVTGREFRVVIFKGKVLLAYEKVSDETLEERASHDDLNPLHSGKPVKIEDQAILSKFTKIADDLYTKMQLQYTGADIIIDQNGNPTVLEVNANPACFFYNSTYGRADFTAVYQECLQEYLS